MDNQIVSIDASVDPNTGKVNQIENNPSSLYNPQTLGIQNIIQEKAIDKPKLGRPCEYCENKNHIDIKTKEYLEKARQARLMKKPFIPYLQELADMLDVDAETVTNWTNKKNEDGSLEHPDFFDTIKRLNNLKELLLLNRTLGRYNPTGAIFQLKTKHGYIETEKKLLAGDPNNPMKYEIEIIPKRQLPKEEANE